ncbi:MAG: hypothetical protein LBI87_05790 [Candidatus Accumulibacter sp.]|jgi:hypothetical protein|nr:hypothetical protein [Accumulibacter sp.]
MNDNLFTICEPRQDVLQGTLTQSDFAADLSQVLRGDGPEEYKNPVSFFANTYPTKGLKNVLKLVAARVLGKPEQTGAVFRLDTQFGGGKTHTLIALAHAMRGMDNVPNADEFLEPALRPGRPIRVAAFDGENADPANGHRLSDAIRAFTPRGSLHLRCPARPVIGSSNKATGKTSRPARIPCVNFWAMNRRSFSSTKWRRTCAKPRDGICSAPVSNC